MSKRSFSLRCGFRNIPFTVPEGIDFQYAPLNHVPKQPDPGAVIRDALDHPVGAPRIEEIVRPGQKVCIISDDNTRMTPVAAILRELLPRLERAGVRRENIFIVFALGSHRAMNRAEMREKVGDEVADRYMLFNSEFEDPSLLIEVGKSELGTPIRVFRPAMEADIRIGIGNITPHGCMGWSGGAKILYPGITASDIVSEFHVMQGLRSEILFGMVEAPTRLAVERWTEQIGLHYIINTILDQDLSLYRAVAGHYIQAHRKAVSYAKEVYGVRIRRRPDVILTSAYPINIDFWQCGKAAYGPASIIREGGSLLLLAECPEGIGPHDKMLDYMALENGPEELQKRVDRRDTGTDLLTLAVGVSMGRVVRHCRTTVITDGLTDEECESGLMSRSPLNGLQEALEASLSRYEDPFLLILPEGGEIVPLLDDHAG